MTASKRARRAQRAIHPDERETLRKASRAVQNATATRARAEAAEVAELEGLLAILETGYLAVATDGTLKDIERLNLAVTFASWLEQEVPTQDLSDLIGRFHDRLQTEGAPARLKAIAKLLDDAGRRAAFHFAVVLAVCDGQVDEDEWGLLGQLADAFGIPDAEASQRFTELFERVTKALGEEE